MKRRDFLIAGSSLGSFMVAGPPLAGILSESCKSPRAVNIPTARGDIETGSLGMTLMHEHILWFAGPMKDNPGYTPIPDDLRTETIDFAVTNLNNAKRVGIDTVVDLTPFRPMDLYNQIADRTAVNIVLSTGFYRRSKVPGWMADIEDGGKMSDLMTADITEGIEGTQVRAGIIKVAEEGGTLSDWEKKVFRAAAHVNKTLGTPVATHTGNALEQFRLLMKEGADPGRILFSHVDVGRKGQPGELIEIVKAGSYLEVDTFGQDYYTPWPELVVFLRTLCDAGYANNIFISIDSNWHWGENGQKIFEGAESPNFDPNAGSRTFSYMITDAVPALLKSGFSREDINTFLVDNPRNFFSAKI